MEQEVEPAPSLSSPLADSEYSAHRENCRADPATLTFAPPAVSLPNVEDIVRSADQQAHQLAALKEATSSFLRQDARLGQLRERTLLLRSRAKFEWSNCHNYRRFVKESQEAFSTEAAAIAHSLPSGDHAERLARLQSAHDQVIWDYDRQNEYAESANALQTKLGALEYDLQVKEASVKDTAESIERILRSLVLPVYSSAGTAVETDFPPSPSSHQSEDVDPLLQNYFDRAGNLNTLTEQAMEIEVEYREERGSRQFKLEHDEILETTEDHFETIWQKKRSELTDQISEAARKAEAARVVCVDNGLDPEQFRRRPRKESDRSLSETVSAQMRLALPVHVDQLSEEDGTAGLTEPIEDDMVGELRILTAGSVPSRNSRRLRTEEAKTISTRDRVLDWIDQVDDQGSYSGGSDRRIIPFLRATESGKRRRSQSLPPERVWESQLRLPFLVSGMPAHEHTPLSLRGPGAKFRKSMRRYTSESNLKERLPMHNPTPEFLEALRRFEPPPSNARGSLCIPPRNEETSSESCSVSEESHTSSSSESGSGESDGSSE